MLVATHGNPMAIKVKEGESVRRNGESYSIGDKVYSKGKANFGVGYIQDIEVLGVHFGFRALIESTILDDPKWYDARNLRLDKPEWIRGFQY